MIGVGWGLLAIGMGLLFALRPADVAGLMRSRLREHRMLRAEEPTRIFELFCLTGGVVWCGIGVAVATLSAVGAF